MKTPLPYYGGKQRLARRIVELMPPHSCYVEPYVGGAAVLFAKGHPSATSAGHYREVINDADETIVNFWREFQDPASEFHHRIQWTPYSKREHDRAKEEQSAWATFVNRAQGFGKVPDSGFARGPLGEGYASVENHTATFAERIARFPEAIERFRCVYLECGDAIETIERWDSPFTLHYCDPPYPGTDCGAYAGEFTVSDLQQLVDCLAECKGSIMLSNYPQPDVVFPDDWQRVEFQQSTVLSAAHKKADPRTEVLWICDRSEQAPEDQRKYMWSPSLGYQWKQGKQGGLF